MVISGVNNYNNNYQISFSAKTRSEREAEKQKPYTRLATVVVTEEDLQLLEIAKKRAREKELKAKEDEQAKASEKQYKQDVKELKETQKIFKDITQANKDKSLLSGGMLKKVGTAADVLITATLSGMALHWSTGKAFSMLHKFFNKPKVANVVNNVKRPFEIVGSSLAEGAQTVSTAMSRKIRATDSGKKILDSAPVKTFNKGTEKIKNFYKNLKADAKNFKTEEVQSGISTIFGISGFGAAVVEKLDKPNKSANKKQKDE